MKFHFLRFIALSASAIAANIRTPKRAKLTDYTKDEGKGSGEPKLPEFEIAFANANAKPYEHKYKAVFNDWDDA
jgi:hypothetical protein